MRLLNDCLEDLTLQVAASKDIPRTGAAEHEGDFKSLISVLNFDRISSRSCGLLQNLVKYSAGLLCPIVVTWSYHGLQSFRNAET